MLSRLIGGAAVVLALGALALQAGEDKNVKDAKKVKERDALIEPKGDGPKDTKGGGAKDKQETKAKPEVAGKVQSVDAGAGKFTLSLEGGKQRTFHVTGDTKFYGPKGGDRGLGKEGLKDDAMAAGSQVRVIPAADAKNAAEVHLPVRTKAPEKDKKGA